MSNRVILVDVRNKREIVGRAQCFGLSERVNGEVDRGYLTQTLVDQSFIQ